MKEAAGLPVKRRTMTDFISTCCVPRAPLAIFLLLGSLLRLGAADAVPAADALKVLPETLYSFKVSPERTVEVKPPEMMRYLLTRKAHLALRDYDKEFDRVLNTPAEIPAYQQRMKEFFLEQLGGLPERTPLNAQIVGELPGDGYRIEKVIYECLPRLYVTALLYLPLTKGPHPGVIVPCGHTANGKAGASYQRACILLAKNGFVVLCYDPIDQGERKQGTASSGYGHNFLAVSSMLVGRAAARIWVWDGMRAIDYLQSRPEVIPDLIGCTGNSGGGTATAYIMAADPRVKCAAPSCFMTSARTKVTKDVMADGEQHLHAQLAYGLADPELAIIRAPQPTLISAATRDYYFSIDGTWDTYRRAKQVFAALGYSERIDLVEARDQHGFKPALRVGVVRWMRRWLMQKDDAITDDQPEHPVLTDEQAQCTPKGTVMLLPGARRSYDFNIDLEKELAGVRQQFWAKHDQAKALSEIRHLTGIRELKDVRRPTLTNKGTIERDGYRIERLALRVAESELWLPALGFVPKNPTGDACLYLHEDGKQADAAPGGPIEALVRKGRIVLAVDLPGCGETESVDGKVMEPWTKLFGAGNRHMFLAYALNTSYLALRAESVIGCAAVLANYQRRNNRVHLISVGRVGPPALHAAALEPQLFQSVSFQRSLVSWSSVVKNPTASNQLVNAVHGVLKVYDLPNLLAAVPKEKLAQVELVDALGMPVVTAK